MFYLLKHLLRIILVIFKLKCNNLIFNEIMILNDSYVCLHAFSLHGESPDPDPGRQAPHFEEAEHEGHLRLVLEMLRANHLYAKLSKCEFWLMQDAFLGHAISATGVLVDPSIVRDVLNWKPPMNILEIYSFLRLAS
jgi:hypothetical protein